MDIATLKQDIATALQSAPFRTSGAALESGAITGLLKGHLGADALELTGAAQTAETDTSVTVRGTLAGPVHGITGATADATFTVAGGSAQLSMVLSGLPTGWKPSQSFASLKGSTFDAFTYASPSLTLDSLGTLPDGFPTEFGLAPFSSAVAAAQAPGLSIAAQVAPTGALGVLSSLLGGSAWSVEGPVAVDGGLPSGVLASAPQAPFSVAGWDIPFALSVVSAVQETAPGTLAPAPATLVQLGADVQKDVGGGTVLHIPVVARTTPGQSVLVIESDLAPGTGITLDQVAALIAGQSTAGQIPSAFPALDDIQLEQVVFSVQPGAKQALLNVGATVGFKPNSEGAKGWSVFDGLIVFNGMDVTFTWAPGGAGVSTSVLASAVLAGGTLDAGIELPSMDFFCKLEEGKSIDISAMVKQVTGGSVGMPQVTCTEFAIFGSVSEGQYRFQATVTDDWVFHIGSKPFALTQVGMDLTYATGAGGGLTGQVVGTFLLAGVEVQVGAEHDATSWTFTGGTVGTQSISLTDLLADVLSLFGVALPASAPQLTLTNLNLTYTTPSNDFGLTAMSSLELLGLTLDFGVEISVSGGVKAFTGYLWIGDNAFKFDFTTGGGTPTLLVGSWVATDAAGVLDLRDILSDLGLDLPSLPSAIDLTLAKAAVVYDATNGVFAVVADSEKYGALTFITQKGATGTLYGFALEALVSVSLSDLPLVGAELAKIQTVEVSNFQISATSKPMGAAGASLNTLLKTYQAYFPQGMVVPTFPVLPAAATTEVVFSADLLFGTGKSPLYVPLDGGTASAAGTAVAAPAQAAPPALPAGAPAGSSSGASGAGVASSSTPDGTVWFTLQKSFGPLTLQRMGLRYVTSTQTLMFELDASLGFGPLTLSLMGLGIGSPLTSFHPTFGLDGLGVSYSQPPLTVAGALLNLSPPDWSSIVFEGAVVINTGEFGIDALAYYGTSGGFPSMFIFVDVSAPLGGPPAFFVTGVSGGFGYNSWINVPPVDKVASFPFLAFLPQSSGYDPGSLGGSTDPSSVLRSITGGKPPLVAPTAGSLWVAAGLTFTSFELVQSEALLVVEAGQDLVITLLGVSRARFPPVGPVMYANVEMELEARLAPLDGVFSVEAVLSPASFLLDRACVLTGGFAFYVWFGDNPNAGDFVLTAGGYHPAFVPPKYYPQVPRVGFHWSLDSSITVSGGAYFALTPSALMAGAALDVTYQSGNLKAWLSAHADVIIRWHPFWFDASIGITVGASYRVNLLLTSFTATVELGCELELYGPPTGGSITVDWYIISFTIHFGADRNQGNNTLQWTDVQAMLPNTAPAGDAVNVLSLNVADGLVSTLKPPAPREGMLAAAPQVGDGSVWVVRGAAFSFSTATPIPASNVTVGSGHSFQGDSFNVHPLGWTNVSAAHAVTITDADGTDVSGAFSAAPAQRGVPAALWGSPPEAAGTPQVPAGGAQLVPGQLAGVTLQVNPPALGSSAGAVDVAANLASEDLELSSAVLPLSATASPTGDVPVNGGTTVSLLASQDQGIASHTAAGARTTIFTALGTLGYAPPRNDDMTVFAATVGGSLAAEPLVVT